MSSDKEGFELGGLLRLGGAGGRGVVGTVGGTSVGWNLGDGFGGVWEVWQKGVGD